MSLPLVHHRFSLGEYEAMIEYGILTSDHRAELLAGDIVNKMPSGSRHAACVTKLDTAFRGALIDSVIIRIQNPIRGLEAQRASWRKTPRLLECSYGHQEHLPPA